MTNENLHVISILEILAKKYEATIAQISLAWLLHKPYIAAAIIGTDTVKQLQENMQAIDVRLEQEDVKKLNNLSVDNQQENKTCKICYRIACKKCGWVATEDEVLQIQQGKLTACPMCGWKPK